MGITFTVYKNEIGDDQSLSNNLVNDIVEDSRGDLWIGTWGGGLDRYDRKTDQFTHFRHHADDPGSIVEQPGVGPVEGQSGDALDRHGGWGIGPDGFDRHILFITGTGRVIRPVWRIIMSSIFMRTRIIGSG